MSNSNASIREPLLKQSHVIFLLVSLILAVVFVLIALFVKSIDEYIKSALFSSAASLLIAAGINAAINHISIKHQTDYTYKLIKTLKHQERMGLSHMDVEILKVKNLKRFFEKPNGTITVQLFTGETWLKTTRDALLSDPSLDLSGIDIRFIFPNFLNKNLIGPLCNKLDGSSETGKLRDKIKGSILEIRNQLSSRFKSVEYYLIDDIPSYLFHYNNNEVVISILNHQRKHISIPTIIGIKGGKLHDFVGTEINSMIGNTTENHVKLITHKVYKNSSTSIESGGYATRVINIDKHFGLPPIPKQ